MHDPMVVLFDIRYPWWEKTSWKRRYHKSFVTVWHVEPNGHDSGEICKGRFSSGLSWTTLKFAARHVRHLRIQIRPYDRVKRWLFNRCAECGHRFLWKQGQTGYMSSDDVLHYPCMNLLQARMNLDDLTKYVTFGSDDTKESRELLGWDDKNAIWRAEYRLKNLP